MGKQQMMIVVKGKEYPCRVTMGALIRFKRRAGHDVSAMAGDVEEMLLFLYCSIASACSADGIPFDLSFDDFADAVEPDQLNDFYQGQEAGQKKSPTAVTT